MKSYLKPGAKQACHLALFISAWCVDTSFAAIPQSERDVLISIYTQASGDSWFNNTNWCDGACPATGRPTFNAPGTECSWFGISCNDTQTHVEAINLIGDRLSGTLPPLQALPELTMFYAYNSIPGNLHGELPSLSGMEKLQIFEVDRNQFSGSIPDLSDLPALQSFSVSQNQLTGEIPALGSLTRLAFFNVAKNQLTGNIPSLTGLTNLQNFFASSNQLTGNIPELTGLTNLSALLLDHNLLSGGIPNLDGLNSLGSITLGGNQLTGSVPSIPGHLGFADSSLCPNPLDTTPSSNDAAWNSGTGYTPWWADPYSNNKCDDLFTGGFEFH